MRTASLQSAQQFVQSVAQQLRWAAAVDRASITQGSSNRSAIIGAMICAQQQHTSASRATTCTEHLAPTSFTRKPALQTVGGGRLRLIKSTTRSKVPSSACTRRLDEISTDGNSSSRWSEQVWRGKAAAAARGKHGAA
ncbi:hypothetical protein F511_36499 [Dorcoceras hygrometricum]|uniref:Uncharacterized protein n=1 Tax=Dorcoceras hygrometricum TaxID=472368 RepID=A0A2Z7CZE3_9LAMI|nr:hypothetical protein F511_36499 [Dorcoceras hygrometricum]